LLGHVDVAQRNNHAEFDHQTDLGMRQIPRRALFAAGAAAGLGLSPAMAQIIPSADDSGPALNARARRKGLFFGSAVNEELLKSDPALMARIDAECGIVVGEAAFKWADLRPGPERYDFTRADALLAWAQSRKIWVRGHTLAWHEGNPDWLEPALTPGNAEKLLAGHIKTVAGHFAGKLQHWDVVNEALHPDDKQNFGLRNSLWLKALGPAYIDIAFHATREADPKALRVINEFGTDYAIDWQERRRGELLKLLADLLRRGVPVQAVGLQAHLDAGETTLDQKILSRFIADIAAMGLKIIVTELDVRDQRLPADIRSRDTAVADHARAWLDAVLPNPAVLGVLSWGMSDRRSWLNEKFARPDKLAQRALPLDVDLNRKRLWNAIAAAIDAAPMRQSA
jgi:endo-1,4-beta-xylanase